VENIDGQLARDEARDGRYYGENLLFSQHARHFEVLSALWPAQEPSGLGLSNAD
jgi:hypothetical protein